MEFPSFIDQLCVVLVLYKKRLRETPLYKALSNDHLSMLSIFIYDNSPEPQSLEDNRIIYKHDSTNSGVSKAYNEGVYFASRSGKKWVLFLDQDTTITISFFNELAVSVSENPGEIAFVPVLSDAHGIVSPFHWSLGKGKRLQVVPGKISLFKFRFANSGLLVTCEAFEKAGGYMENIPLDFSDIAFGERLQRVTDHVKVMNIRLSHSFSGSIQMHWQEALTRFHYFCVGAFAMGSAFGDASIYFVRALLRALNLTFRYKKLNFIKMFLRHAAHN